MSCSLNYRKTPTHNDWAGSFKGSLRDQLRNKFGEGKGVISLKDISYLEGVRDCQVNELDISDLNQIIEILMDRGTIDLFYEC